LPPSFLSFAFHAPALPRHFHAAMLSLRLFDAFVARLIAAFRREYNTPFFAFAAC